MLPPPFKRRFLAIHLAVMIAQFWFAITALRQIPGEAENKLIFGLSATRLIPVVLLAAAGLWAGWGLYRVLADNGYFEKVERNLDDRLSRPSYRSGRGMLAGIVLISSAFLLTRIPSIDEQYTQAIFERLRPLILLLTGLSIQGLLFILIYAWEPTRLHLQRSGRAWAAFAGIFGLALLSWALLGGMDLRLRVDPVGWNTQAAPVMDHQVLLVFVAGLVLVAMAPMVRRFLTGTGSPREKWVDRGIFILLWLLAILYWQSLPLEGGWYMASPSPPNFSFYPNSDALVYDTTAQRLQYGAGFGTWNTDYPRRPMYTFFLALLYGIRGQDYEAVVNLQSAILAVFPALVFLFTRTLYNRLAGVLAGLFVLLREGAALALVNVITISHTRMAMTDVPAAAGMALFAWITVKWLAGQRFPAWKFLAAGAVLGVFMQVRIEIAAVVPAVFLLAFLASRGGRKSVPFGAAALWMGVGTALVLAPWIWRNYRVGGEIFLEAPGNRLDFLIDRLQGSFLEPAGRSIAVRSRGYADRPTAEQDEAESLLATITNHALHSQAQMVLMFPDTYRIFESLVSYTGQRSGPAFVDQCCKARSYVRGLPFWVWQTWAGEIPPHSLVPILVNLLVLCLGGYSGWRRKRWAGLLPLFLSSAVILINALARTSGGRYLQSVDWLWIAMYGAGLAEILLWIGRRAGRTDAQVLWEGDTREGQEQGLPGTRSRAFVAAGVSLLFGLLLPVGERVYEDPLLADRLAGQYAEFEGTAGPEVLAGLSALSESGGFIYQGRAMYPRFQESGLGESGSAFATFNARPYNRFSFYLIGPTSIGVVLPVEGNSIRLDDDTDVIVWGCRTLLASRGEYFIDAYGFYVPDDGRLYLRQPAPEAPSCSP